MNRKLFGLSLLIIICLTMTVPIFSAGQLYKIAVLPFDDGSIKDRSFNGSWNIGKGIADELVTELLNTNKFRVIEREQINRVLQEQDFGTTGRVDASTAAKIGKILGVDFLVIGRVTEFSFRSTGAGAIQGKSGIGLGLKTTNANVAMDVRLVDSSTAEILSSVTGKGAKRNTNVSAIVKYDAITFGSDEFRQTDLGIATREAVVSVAKQLGEKAYATGRSPVNASLRGTVAYAGNTVIINIGSTAGVKPGMIFTVKHVLEIVKDPDSGEVLDTVSEAVAELTVTEVKEKSATCTVSAKLNSKYAIAVGDAVEQKN